MLCMVARQPLPYPAEPSSCCCSSSSLASIELLNDFIKSADAELIWFDVRFVQIYLMQFHKCERQ